MLLWLQDFQYGSFDLDLLSSHKLTAIFGPDAAEHLHQISWKLDL